MKDIDKNVGFFLQQEYCGEILKKNTKKFKHFTTVKINFIEQRTVGIVAVHILSILINFRKIIAFVFEFRFLHFLFREIFPFFRISLPKNASFFFAKFHFNLFSEKMRNKKGKNRNLKLNAIFCENLSK